LAADYVDAGVCEAPTPASMGAHVAKISRSAVDGLRTLDYFHENSPFAYRVQRSFVDLYEFFDEELNDDEKHRLHWNTICLEHALCKYVRFVTEPRFREFFTATDFSRYAHSS
jgi:hypothetical protein